MEKNPDITSGYESDDDGDDIDEVDILNTSFIELEEFQTPRKRPRVQSDLTRRFPSRLTRRRWLKHGSLINLKYVANKIRDKRVNQILTLGFDDTTKAAGRQLFDVKSTNITLDGDDMDRETYTTGFSPNLSHSGQDQSTTLRHSLQVLSVLAKNEPDDHYSIEDIIENFDFWMSDRSADGNIVLDNLGIDENKRLKCCGHTTLCIDDAIGSVLLEAESVVGLNNLIGSEVGSFSFQVKNSIIIQGLIALSKGLSSSHASLSYSLYMQYKMWRNENELETKDFVGFKSNRFGRIVHLASLFLSHKDNLQKFFSEVIDENSNRLFLVLSCYIHSEWFEVGCKVFCFFGEKIVKPLCEILGIDESKKQKRKDRNWNGVKTFYETKILELKVLMNNTEAVTNYDKLISKCSEKVVENLERQLNQMIFFKDEADEETIKKMEHAPLTNSGCESRMAQLDVRVKFSGGAAPVDTISDKQIVAVNKYLVCNDLHLDRIEEEFKWARTSEEAKKVLKIQKEFLAQVKLTKSLSLKAKQVAKQKKIQRALNLAATCRKHGGPVTVDNLELLEKLTDKQLCCEVLYLKATYASEIKLKKRVKITNSEKYKMVQLPAE